MENSFENPNIENQSENKKEEKLKEVRDKVDKIEDGLGKKIEEGIKEPVVMLNALDFNTSGSCEGHTDWGLDGPWIEIQAPDEPEFRFEKEEEIFREVAEENNVDFEDLRPPVDNLELYEEAMNRSCLHEETEEYEKWRSKNEEFMNEMEDFLEDFYKDREVDENVRIRIGEVFAGGTFRIYSGGEDYLKSNEPDEERKKGLKDRLKKYRSEMDEFADYLKEKYLEK